MELVDVTGLTHQEYCIFRISIHIIIIIIHHMLLHLILIHVLYICHHSYQLLPWYHAAVSILAYDRDSLLYIFC